MFAFCYQAVCVFPVSPQCCDLCYRAHKPATIHVAEMIIFTLVTKIAYK